MNNYLETYQLSTGYGKNVIQKDLNLSLVQGQLHILLGRNGSGKSTLIRTLAGLQNPIEGNIRINGKNLHQLSSREKATQLGIVLTHNDSGGLLTVREIIQMGRYPYTNWMATLSEADHQKVDEAIRKTGIENVADKMYHELSDGQQQKTILARALAQDTPLILLDEPTTHLDFINKSEIIKLLTDLVSLEGKTILLSTHDLDLASIYGNRLWVINEEGKILDDLPQNLMIKGSLKHIFSKSL